MRILRTGALFLSEASGGWLPAPSLSDLVVRDRASGDEVARAPAGDPAEAGTLLQHVQQDLEELSAVTFAEQWGIRRPQPSR